MEHYHLEKDLSDREFAILQSELSQYSKSAGLAYVLWFFFGWMGIHQFYIGQILRGVLYLGLCFGGWFGVGAAFADAALSTITMIMWGMLGILLFVDLFTIPSQIKKIRKNKKKEIIKDIQSQSRSEVLGEIDRPSKTNKVG